MAIEWYRIDAGLKSHPKRSRVAKVAGCSKLEAMAHIVLLYTLTAIHAEDGGIEKFSPSEIEDSCEWEGKEGLLYRAFIEAKLIDETPTGRIVHNWYEKNWKHVEEKRRRNHEYRESKKANRPGFVRAPTPQGVDSGSTPRHQEDRNERTNERTNEPSIRLAIDEALTRFAETRQRLPIYAGTSYDVGDAGRAAASNLMHNTPPTDAEMKVALDNFFASDAGFTFNHSAHSFFGKFHAFLSAPLNGFGKGKHQDDAPDGSLRRQGGPGDHGRKDASDHKPGSRLGKGGRAPDLRGEKSIAPG